MSALARLADDGVRKELIVFACLVGGCALAFWALSVLSRRDRRARQPRRARSGLSEAELLARDAAECDVIRRELDLLVVDVAQASAQAALLMASDWDAQRCKVARDDHAQIEESLFALLLRVDDLGSGVRDQRKALASAIQATLEDLDKSRHSLEAHQRQHQAGR